MIDRRLPWVLVVDDNEANRYAVSRMLRAAGFETSEATTGRQAIQYARTNPDVIVLDVNLPDINGFEVVRQLRSEPATSSIPILHLSASYMRNEDRAFGLDNGANAYLTHPIEPPVFVATLRSLLRVRRLEAERQAAASEWQVTFDAISDMVCVLDRSGAITRANRAAAAGFGRSVTELCDKQWAPLMAETFPGLDAQWLGEHVAGGAAAVREVRAGARWLRIAMDPLSPQSSYAGSMVCVVSDITQRKVAEAERGNLLEAAERARMQAEAGNRAKSEFLSTMNHEIRTPINAILGYAQILDMGLAGSVSAEQRDQLDRLRRSATHLLRLVNEVLDLAQVEGGRMRVEREQASTDEAIEDALAIGRPLALARGIAVDVNAPRRLLFMADSGRVRQILVNLLSNAVKFSPPGSRIVLASALRTPAAGMALDPSHQYVVVEVIDSGIGVRLDQRDEIFEPFVQVERGPTRAWGGSGLGLTISRRLARLMGGDLTVASRDGTGSVFSLWLPAVEDQSLVATAEHASVTLPSRPPFNPLLFAQLGRLLASEALSVGDAMAVRLRSDGAFPPAGALSDAQLVDHIPAYVVDVGLALTIVSEVGVDASTLLHDGAAIRTEIAQLHGAQRRRLGWTVEQVEREYDLLAAELGRVLRASAGIDAQQAEGAMELVARLIEQSKAAGARGHREAGGADD